MAEPTVRYAGRAIVVIVPLNPEMFHPGWFLGAGLIRSDEAEKAKVELVAPEGAIFQLPWAHLQVLPDRFELVLEDATTYEAGRDLAASTFRVLSGLRLRAVGLNHYFHWKVDTEAEHSVDSLAPYVVGVLADSTNDAHVARIQARGTRNDDHKGSIGIDIQPSTRVQRGFFCSVNDHYDLSGYDRDEADERFQAILGASWDTSAALALEMATNFVHLATTSER